MAYKATWHLWARGISSFSFVTYLTSKLVILCLLHNAEAVWEKLMVLLKHLIEHLTYRNAKVSSKHQP